MEDLTTSIEKLVESFQVTVEELENHHVLERMVLLKKINEDILTIAPELVFYDESLREKNVNLVPDENPSTAQKYLVGDQFYDSDIDQPMDYKVS